MTLDVSEDLVAFLRSRLDVDDIPVAFDVDDDIGLGKYNASVAQPFVTPVSEDPVVPGGGQTGYTALGADGPLQDQVWLVLVDCWGGAVDASIYQDEDAHPDGVANVLGQLVARACREAAAAGAPDGYEWVNADPPQTANDDQRDPTHYRRQVTCRLKTTR